MSAAAPAITGGEASAVDTPIASTTVDTPAVETTSTEQPTTVEQTTEQPAEGTAQQAADDGQQIAGTSDPAVKAAIEALKQSNPAAARKIRDMAGTVGALLQEFPGGLKEVRGLKQTVEQYGGSEGLQSLAQAKTELDGIDQKLVNGDVSIFADIEKQAPGALGKLIPDAIGTFAKSDPEGYNHIMSGVITATLSNYRIPDTLTAIARGLAQIKDADGQVVASEEIEAIQQMLGTFGEFSKMAQKAPEKKIDPERQKLQEEKQAWEQQKQAEYKQGFYKQGRQYADDAVSKSLKTELAARKSNLAETDDEYGIIVNEIRNKTVSLMEANPEIVKKVQTLESVRDMDGLLKYSNSNFDKYLPKAVKFVLGRYEKFSGTPVKKAPTPVQQPTGPQTLKQAPTPEQIDFTRIPEGYSSVRAAMMNGKAYLKNQKALFTW